MHSIKQIIRYKSNLDKKLTIVGIRPYAKKIFLLYQKFYILKLEIQSANKKRKYTSKEIVNIYKSSNYGSMIKNINYCKNKIIKYKREREKIEKMINKFLLIIPNFPEMSVPYGKYYKKNKILYNYGTPNILDFNIKSHK